MKKNILTFSAISLMLILTFNFIGCDKEGNPIIPVTVTTTKGAYILSEGGGSPGSSTLSLYSVVKDSFYLNIFSGGTLGSFPDGLMLYNNSLFVTEQGSFGGAGKIHKLDTTGVVQQSSFPFGTNPYSFAIQDNKIYVTNGPASSVSVLDLGSLSFIKTISVGVYPQEIIALGGKVFVCNTSLFGGAQDSTVSVIDPQLDSVIARITVRKDPSSLAITNDGKLLIGCPSASGYIYKIDPVSLAKMDSIFNLVDGLSKDMSLNSLAGDVYYISASNNISKVNLSTKQSVVVITNTDPANRFFYGYGYDEINSKHYILDARNFVLSGHLYIHNSSGVLEKDFTTGIAPRRVIFKR